MPQPPRLKRTHEVTFDPMRRPLSEIDLPLLQSVAVPTKRVKAATKDEAEDADGGEESWVQQFADDALQQLEGLETLQKQQEQLPSHGTFSRSPCAPQTAGDLLVHDAIAFYFRGDLATSHDMRYKDLERQAARVPSLLAEVWRLRFMVKTLQNQYAALLADTGFNWCAGFCDPAAAGWCQEPTIDEPPDFGSLLDVQ